MAPKTKKGKKAQDDWEEELGEIADPIAQAEATAKAQDGEDEVAYDDSAGGC